MNNTLQAKESFTKEQEKSLILIIKKEKEICKTQEEIEKILKANNLNALDVDTYKREKKVQEFLNTKLS